jgi:hypothetical protein
MTTMICIDRLSAHPMALVVDCRSYLARSRPVERVARVLRRPFDVCGLIRRAKQPRWAECHIYQGDVWIP